MNPLNLSSKHLLRLAKIKIQIERLQSKLDRFVGEPVKAGPQKRKRRKMSAAGRARIAAAQKARWAKVKAKKK